MFPYKIKSDKVIVWGKNLYYVGWIEIKLFGGRMLEDYRDTSTRRELDYPRGESEIAPSTIKSVYVC